MGGGVVGVVPVLLQERHKVKKTSGKIGILIWRIYFGYSGRKLYVLSGLRKSPGDHDVFLLRVNNDLTQYLLTGNQIPG